MDSSSNPANKDENVTYKISHQDLQTVKSHLSCLSDLNQRIAKVLVLMVIQYIDETCREERDAL
jgi:hypothetical protein